MDNATTSAKSVLIRLLFRCWLFHFSFSDPLRKPHPHSIDLKLRDDIGHEVSEVRRPGVAVAGAEVLTVQTDCVLPALFQEGEGNRFEGGDFAL